MGKTGLVMMNGQLEVADQKKLDGGKKTLPVQVLAEQ